MLEALVGNQNIQKILLFLFVNGKCYGTQIHRILRCPLTPLQKALARLEKGGVIVSYYEGKTRLYQFNPAYPLLTELESLLKSAYTLLSAADRKDYYVAKEEWVNRSLNPFNSQKILQTFWQKLTGIKSLIFNARTKSKDSGWNGKGKGEVLVSSPVSQTLVFNEKGTWLDKAGNEITFSNAFRWVIDRDACVISLEHLRRGPEHPVFLFHLAPSNHSTLSSVDSHLCGGDTYFGKLHDDPYSLRLNCRVIGPKKNEEIDYYYS